MYYLITGQKKRWINSIRQGIWSFFLSFWNLWGVGYYCGKVKSLQTVANSKWRTPLLLASASVHFKQKCSPPPHISIASIQNFLKNWCPQLFNNAISNYPTMQYIIQPSFSTQTEVMTGKGNWRLKETLSAPLDVCPSLSGQDFTTWMNSWPHNAAHLDALRASPSLRDPDSETFRLSIDPSFDSRNLKPLFDARSRALRGRKLSPCSRAPVLV